MKIIDITSHYIKHIPNEKNPAAYEKSYPALFDHYFRFWAKRKNPYTMISSDDTRLKLKLIKDCLRDVKSKFNSSGFELDSFSIVLFVGQSTSNGHAFMDGDKYVIWIPIETYNSSLYTRVFLAHEIAHAIHYTKAPDFYFKDEKDKDQVSRQLITEGIATYLTSYILDVSEREALWADYLTKDQADLWMTECSRREPELKKYTFINLTVSEPGPGIFHVADPGDIFKYRAGYYIGLQAVKYMVLTSRFSLENLLSMPRDTMQKLLIEYLNSGN